MSPAWTSGPLFYLRAEQPIGDIYLVVLTCQLLVDISYADRRELVDEYGGSRMFLGVQRQLSDKRIKEIREYVATRDATFPGSVILSISERCVDLDPDARTITLHPASADNEAGLDEISVGRIARIIDGQHRIEGLKGRGAPFELPATLFIGADEASEAAVFATVNLAQTKVNRSLAIDLLELAKTRSPQKTSHNIAVALDSDIGGPLGGRIKRLGVTTEGRQGETITQATFVDSLLKLITNNPVADRELYLRGKKIARPTPLESEKMPLRNLFAREQDQAIARGLDQYLRAVRKRWPHAWGETDQGAILSRTAGYRALMRFWAKLLRTWQAYDSLPLEERYHEVLSSIEIADDQLNTELFGYGSGAEAELYRRFVRQVSPSS